MNESKTKSGGWAANTASNTVHLAYWTGAWVLSMAVSAFGPKLLWDYATVPTALAVLANLAIGLGMILANRRHLRGLDEMQQRIFLEAAALTLGVGLVAGLSYEMLESVRLVSFEPKISHLVVLMSLTFLAGMLAGHRRYR
jgi:hypothetical protein